MAIENTRRIARTHLPFLANRRLAAAIGAFAFCCSIIVGAIAWSSSREASLREAPGAVITVTGVVATSKQWARTLKASGPIMAWQEAIIGTELSGRRLIELRVNVGDRVEKGEALARFDTQTLKAQEAELVALLAQAKATEAQAESDRARAARLRVAKAMSEQETDTAETREKIAKAQTTAAQARLDAVRLQIAQALIVAPTAGVVSSRTATLGAVGAPGGELFRIIVDDRLEWRGALTARQLRSVAPGQEVVLTLPDGSRATGRVRQISPALDSLRMAIVYADVDGAGLARAGMYADGAIMLAAAPAVVVPAASVVIRDGRGYVFKLPDRGDKVAQLPVVTGRRQSDEVEILRGVEAGETVVCLGAGFLDDGDLVRRASTEVATELSR